MSIGPQYGQRIYFDCNTAKIILKRLEMYQKNPPKEPVRVNNWIYIKYEKPTYVMCKKDFDKEKQFVFYEPDLSIIIELISKGMKDHPMYE